MVSIWCKSIIDIVVLQKQISVIWKKKKVMFFLFCFPSVFFRKKGNFRTFICNSSENNIAIACATRAILA